MDRRHQLIDEIANLFSLARPAPLRLPLSFLVFASWLPEYAPVAPFLWVMVLAGFTAADRLESHGVSQAELQFPLLKTKRRG